MTTQEADDPQTLHALARLLLETGRAEEAIAKLQTAVEEYRSAGDLTGEGEIELLLAKAYREIGGAGREQGRLVRLHGERAEVSLRRAGDMAGLVEALSLLAVFFNEAHDDPNLGYTLAKLQQIDPRAASWFTLYTDAVSQMFVLPEEAARLFRQALQSLDRLARNREWWREQCLRKLTFLTGLRDQAPSDQAGRKSRSWVGPFQEAFRLILRGEDDEKVEPLLDEAIGLAEDARRRIRSEAKQRELSNAMGPLYTAKVTLADRVGRHGQALDTLELNSSRSLLSRGALRSLWARYPGQSFETLRAANALITESLVRYVQTGGTGEWRQLQLALLRRREASHAVQEELVRLVPPPHELFTPSTSGSLQGSLRADDAVVVFLPGGSVYVLRAWGVSKAASFDMASVADACERYRSLASAPDRPMPDRELEDIGGAIASACLEPIAPLVRDATRVFIVPHGRLWSVPLGVLGREPLTASHSVSIVPNLSLAHRLIKQIRPTRRVDRFVGVGNPDQTLPGAAMEVEEAARRFDDRAAFTGPGSDFGQVLQYLFDADVIHLACHGVSFRDFPELSYLHIAGSPESPVPWFVEDIVRVPMSPRLVVLSACDAGTSVALPGEEYIGFPGVFLVADTNTVVAPLWAIDDTSTFSLMRAFYEESRHRSPSRALRVAQEIVREDPATAHPFHWAAFEVFGLP